MKYRCLKCGEEFKPLSFKDRLFKELLNPVILVDPAPGPLDLFQFKKICPKCGSRNITRK